MCYANFVSLDSSPPVRKINATQAVSREATDAEWEEHFKHMTQNIPSDLIYMNTTEVADMFALLRSMFKLDPEQRPTAEEVLRHPWFAGRDGDGEPQALIHPEVGLMA